MRDKNHSTQGLHYKTHVLVALDTYVTNSDCDHEGHSHSLLYRQYGLTPKKETELWKLYNEKWWAYIPTLWELRRFQSLTANLHT